MGPNGPSAFMIMGPNGLANNIFTIGFLPRACATHVPEPWRRVSCGSFASDRKWTGGIVSTLLAHR
eukprot:2988472-Pyramimonas_sp.AAC.1